ncbi:membrane protein [Frondihabitans sucicola]|uniref:Membrane protein insertase YidC n=1 Tax=Frondihabitans sucicola TaxID=1268041 RepID=A0ABN6Y1E0_9MICO|nr:membrane protein insertase YidC [Frondihabitans sucicola]BDZ49922.1 membrane protein [Frondihabitans sucicola]
MNPFDLPPVAAALDGLYHLVMALITTLEPWAGASAAALAIVTLTAAVRLVLLPVAISQVRAEIQRRRIAPRVEALRTRHRSDREALTRALGRLYTSERVSPVAGIGPTLLQVPVLAGVYALFSHATIAGHANALLAHTVFGAALGANLVAGLPHVAAFVVILLLLAGVVELTRRANLRFAPQPATPVPGAAALARVLPFVTVVFAALAPFAAALYLVTSAAWTLGERAILRRRLA